MRALYRFATAAAVVLPGSTVDLADAQEPERWTVTELVGLEEGNQVRVTDLNDSGVAVGFDEKAQVPIVWDAGGVPEALPVSEDCIAMDPSISDAGWIVARALCGDPDALLLRWGPDGELTTQELLSVGQSVDDRGIVAGLRHTDGGAQAFVQAPGQDPIDLDDAGAEQSAASDLTSWGYVVGGITGLPGVDRDVAVGWFGPYVFGLLDTEENSYAEAVNAYGVALVSTYEGDGASSSGHLVIPGYGPYALDDDGTSDRVADINDAAIVVGTRDDVDGRFYILDVSFSFTDLVSDEDAATFGLARPQAVNNDAWVVGHDDGRGWLLRPPT